MVGSNSGVRKAERARGFGYGRLSSSMSEPDESEPPNCNMIRRQCQLQSKANLHRSDSLLLILQVITAVHLTPSGQF